MKIKARKRYIPEEAATSSDIAFLLIIYFLVIAGFNINQGFLMNLPAKNSIRYVLKEDLMRFEMDNTGQVSLDNARLTLAEAERNIRRAVAGHPNMAVVLSVDPRAPWQGVVNFVELAQKLQVDSFSFNMKQRLP